jgi:hypothetical protein
VGNISGIRLDVRAPGDARTALILSMPDKISRLEMLKETVNNVEEYTVALSNVQVTIEEKNGPNKFVGISSAAPLEIRLPKGEYTMSLAYPGYKILNKNYYLVDSVNISFELSGDLIPETVIMLPKKVGE